MSKPSKHELISSLSEVFPNNGSSIEGTRLLFALKHEWPDYPGNLTWVHAAQHINDIVDVSLIHSMSHEDFRYFLPGFILGLAYYLEEPETSLLGDTVFFQLYASYKPEHWDEYFIERWCRLTEPQYEFLETVLKWLALPLFDLLEYDRAIRTLSLARLRAQHGELSGS